MISFIHKRPLRASPRRWGLIFWPGSFITCLVHLPWPLIISQSRVQENRIQLSELEPVFLEAVEVISNGRVPQFEHTSLFWRLEEEETNIPIRYPEDLARLLVHLTSSFQMPRDFCEELDMGGTVLGLHHNLEVNICQFAGEGAMNKENQAGRPLNLLEWEDKPRGSQIADTCYD